MYGQQYYYQNPYTFIGNQGEAQYEVLPMSVDDQHSAPELLQQQVPPATSTSETQEGVFDYYIPNENDSSQHDPNTSHNIINNHITGSHRQEITNENFSIHSHGQQQPGDNNSVGTVTATHSNVIVGIFDETKSYSSPEQQTVGTLFQDNPQFSRNSHFQNSNFCSFSYH